MNTVTAKFVRDYLVNLPRSAKLLILLIIDTLGYALAGAASAWVLAGGINVSILSPFVLLVSVVACFSLAWLMGIYQSVVRFIGLELQVAALGTAAGAAFLSTATLSLSGALNDPARWALVFFGMTLFYVMGSRYLARLVLHERTSPADRKRVIIYGAGTAGAQLAVSLSGGGEYQPVAMVDDDPSLVGKSIAGLSVFPTTDIERLVERYQASYILLAIPSASRRSRRQVLERLAPLPVHVQTVPDINDIVSGNAKVSELRDIEVKDLLGREAVPPDPELMAASIRGKNVLVTGAGGSIGSELCRQILAQAPRRLVLLELSEVSLYEIDKELTRLALEQSKKCEIVPLLGSVHHEDRLKRVLRAFDINTVYHAAAYKHVPIVERNIFEGIHNNIFGTLHTARASFEVGVENFVLISTDKAVNPTNVMGATKRFAELILQGLSLNYPDSRACMVRFGNVLESSGSVVPLFREQIRKGGPVTVTHRDIIRYFMTIPEAAQLVIQAAALAKGGDVFVLDMGKPVRINNLARRMINLAGQTVRDEQNPDGDIEIQYTGLRPAEKLYEELLIGSNVTGTRHPRIMRANESYLPVDTIMALARQLQAASQKFDYETARRVLLRAVNEYQPTEDIADLLCIGPGSARKIAGQETVVEFTSRQA